VTRVIGNGVAASCCAHLLKGVEIVGDRRPKVPALLISSATQALVEDVFQRRGVFDGAARITRRVVRWGDAAETVEVPHSAIVISEAELVDRLGAVFSRSDRDEISVPDQHHFGTRMATAFPVVSKLTEGCAIEAACLIESVASGWLFLLPGWLLSIGDSPLEKSELVAGQIESIGEAVGRFPAYPRISDPLHGEDWLAVGGEAMAFDPICGDGVGNAIREAILATAVIRATPSGDGPALFEHYRARLVAGFLKHLELCRPFYAACSGEWWRCELTLLDSGIAWCRAQLAHALPFRYQLRDFNLQRIPS
jgi:hypothetical protein